ncbi:uncharacterized protein LOC143378236 [Andrena cerasifolii]|uniref:uncharacterized protein LOC143378236 n=1 Tax=Andrena cerasifolii TaxID=2819439 RepID=UPI0040380162
MEGKEGEKGEERGKERVETERKVDEKEEEAKRRGRKTNAERLARERSMSGGSIGEIAELWKRKREKEEQGHGEESGIEAFQKSRKVGRSPEGEREGGGIERLLKEMRAEMRKDLKEVKEQGREAREDMASLREKMEEWEEKWRREKKELGNRMERVEKRLEEVEREEEKIKEMEERLKNLEMRRKKKEGVGEARREEGVGKDAGREEWETRVQGMERKLEMKEREERRKNIIIKGVGREGTAMRRAKEVLDVVGIQGRIEGVRELGGRRQGREEVMLEVKMESMEVKREIMRNKGKLKGRKERIGDDLTWKERKMQWQIRVVGEEEERKGNRVRVKYGKIEIEGKTWFWDEQGEVLRDWRGKERGRAEWGAKEVREGERGREEVGKKEGRQGAEGSKN